MRQWKEPGLLFQLARAGDDVQVQAAPLLEQRRIIHHGMAEFRDPGFAEHLARGLLQQGGVHVEQPVGHLRVRPGVAGMDRVRRDQGDLPRTHDVALGAEQKGGAAGLHQADAPGGMRMRAENLLGVAGRTHLHPGNVGIAQEADLGIGRAFAHDVFL